MGAWGTGLYQDDVTLDVKDTYVECLRKGMSKEEANTEIFNYFSECLDDEEDDQ